jgi:hypothetical protein
MLGRLAQVPIRDILTILLQWALPLALILLYARWQQGRLAAQRNSLVGWFSSLHSLSKQLSKHRAPTKMVEAALVGTMRTFGTRKGYAVLRGAGEGDSTEASGQGLSTRTVEALGSEPLLNYCASAADRWDTLLIVSGLSSTETEVAAQGDPLFQKFIARAPSRQVVQWAQPAQEARVPQ